MMWLLLAVSEEITKWSDIISNVVQEKWGVVAGSLTIATVTPILINQIWATIRSWVVSSKTKKRNITLQTKLDESVEKLQKAKDDFAQLISTGFSSLESKADTKTEYMKKIKQEAINKVLGLNQEASTLITQAKDVVSEKISTLSESIDTKIDETVAKVDEIVADPVAINEIVATVKKKTKKIIKE